MIDLDHNAGGQVRAEVAAALGEWLAEPHGNPSSPHALGRRARAAIDSARESVAALVGSDPAEVIFTSGATEANNQVVESSTGHVVTSVLEHPSLLRPLARFGASRRVRSLRGDAFGRVSVAEALEALQPETGLVSITWASGEIGTLQPVAEIARAIRRERPAGVLLHSDAVQAVAWQEIGFADSALDLLTVSGHKIGAPTGAGALIVRADCQLAPLLYGGPQERGRRAGTPNVSGLVGFGVAAGLALREREKRRRLVARDIETIFEVLQSQAGPVQRLGPPNGLPNTLAIAFLGMRGDALQVALDLEGICVSTGPACAAGGAEPSPALVALGLDDEIIKAALRISLAEPLGQEQAVAVATQMATVVTRARRRAVAGRAA